MAAVSRSPTRYSAFSRLHCIVIGESDAAIRVRIADVWDVDILKEMILAVDDALFSLA